MDYVKLFQDQKDGLIDERMTLVFDNDGGYWRCETDDEEESDKMNQEYGEKYGTPDGYSDLVDIANAAGVKSEWC